jgi:hypothetical protein
MQQKFSIGFCTFSYGGNGGISSEVPDIREWMIPAISGLSQNPRVSAVQVWNLSDTPITMTRNRAVLMARQYGIDVLVMVDSDMKPDMYVNQPGAKSFIDSSFEFLADHYPKGPVVIGAPYCGPPPHENVYVFRWQAHQSENANPDFKLEMYDRDTAAKMAGIQECAALPTGLIMYDMRAFEVTEPQDVGDNPWFYYEYPDKYQSEKASTEDVTMTRDLSLAGTQKLGYNPVFCNWDAWAGHWKPKCVGKPQIIQAVDVSAKLKQCWQANYDGGVKVMSVRPSGLLENYIRNRQTSVSVFDDMGMGLPDRDVKAIHSLIQSFIQQHGRAPVVLEVGSWAGRSAIEMCNAGAQLVKCVDTWEGNKYDEGTSAYDGSRGTPLEVFRRNTANHPVSWKVGRSPDVAKEIEDGCADIVYIDAEHDYDSVMADIAAWRPKARHILAGHDYQLFEGVRKAVADSGYTPDVNGNVWHVRL